MSYIINKDKTKSIYYFFSLNRGNKIDIEKIKYQIDIISI